MTALVFAYTIIVTLFDLTAAWSYAQNAVDVETLQLLRQARDVLAAGLCLWGLMRVDRNPALGLAIGGYVVFILAYLVLSDAKVDTSLVNASAVRLTLPPVLVLIGFGTLVDERKLVQYAMLVSGLACLSALFGAWDIRHTEFWTSVLEYGYYLHDVKGIITGYAERWVLPFNFFGYEYQRRAAGLVAAPLAQGSFLALGAVFSYATLRRHMPLALAVLALCLFGVWQSGTRGAFLMLVLALPIYMLANGRTQGTMARNLAILGLIAVVAYEAVAFVVSYTVAYADGSTIGHADALQRNLEHLDEVLLVGKGLGMAGGEAAALGFDVAGGGEGALFSVIYQLGMPGGVAFLVFYGVCAVSALRRVNRLPPMSADIALAAFALTIGVATSLVLSEHIFSLSATAVFWIALGGVLAQPLKRDSA